MPKLIIRTARHNIYEVGLKQKADNKQGFTLDRTKPLIHVPGGPVDRIIIPKGTKYYVWHPKGQPWQYSKTKPDLRSDWVRTVDDWQNRIDELEEIEREDRQSTKEEIETEINEKIDELQQSFENMPESLQTEEHILKQRITDLEELRDSMPDND